MKTTTKSLIALLVLVAMCVSFCVPVFAATEVEEHAADELKLCTAATGEPHELKNFGLEGEKWTDDNAYVEKVKVVNPGCGEQGYTIYMCKTCEEVFVDSWVDADDNKHDWVEIDGTRVEPNCVEAGSYKVECQKCHKVESREIEALGHKFGEWVYSNPDYICGDAGVTRTKTCTVCEGKLTGGEVIEPVNTGAHEWEITFTKKPTCVADGKANYKCIHCTVKGSNVTVPKLDPSKPSSHTWTWDDADITTPPTCENFGIVSIAKCALCKVEEKNHKIDKADHNFETVAEVPATCYEDGTKEYVACTVCGTKDAPYDKWDEEDFVIPAFEHLDDKGGETCRTYNDAKYEPQSCKGEFWYCATSGCANEGVKATAAGDCAKCGKELAYDDGGVGHAYFDCSRCGGTDIHVELPRLPHGGQQHSEQAPTCTQFGFKTDACLVCGDYTKFEMIPPYTHDLANSNNKLVKNDTESVEPKCGVAGTYVYYCAVCNFKVEENKPALEHVFEEKYVEPTCYAEGYRQMVCTRVGCGVADLTVDGADADGKYGYEPKNPDNHVEKTNWTTQPTCTTSGLSLTFCEKCKWVDPNGFQVVPALGHNANAYNAQYPDDQKLGKHQVGPTVSATCTENEYIIWECDICELKNQKEEKADSALGHNYLKKNGKDVPATCLTDGYYEVKCTRCDVKNTDNGITKDKKGEDFWVPATGHNYPTEYDKYYKEDYPKCIDDPATARDERIGQVYYKCANNCDIDFVTNSIRVWDINEVKCHTENAYRDDTKDHRAATCAVTGIEYWFCPDCDNDFAVILPMPEHTPGTKNPGKEPTCTDDGIVPTYYCPVCKQNIVDLPEGRTEESYKSFGGHDFADATCDAPRTCKRPNCGATEGEALGHHWLDATCTLPKRCDVCGKTEGKQNGHSVTSDIVVSATCTTDGYTYTYCTVCLKSWNFKAYTYATGHDFENGTLNNKLSKAPTCTTEGWNVYDCANGCKEVSEKYPVDKLREDGKHINAAGETFGDTCNEGVTDYVCTTPNCGHKEPVHSYKTDENGNRVPYSVVGDCTKHSYVLYLCLECKADEMVSYDEPFAEHDWGDWETIEEATLTKNGYAMRKCKRCTVWDDEKKTLTAESAVQFDYKITDMKGNQVADKTYSGRIKVTISTTAKDAKGNSLKLDFKFNNKILTFVSCNVSEKAAANEFLKYTTSSTVKVANENGCVTILTADMNAKDNYAIISCEFVELVFDINYDSNGEDIAFTADSLILDNEQGEVTSLDSAIEVCKTAALGKLTGTGEVGVADLNKFINIYSTGEYTSAADVDRDGELDIDDYVALQNYILGDKSSIK